MPVVRALYIYPVKATAGRSLEAAPLTERGLAGDRRWMLVDASGRFLTQRQHPPLALVRAHVRNAQVVLEAPGMEPLGVPFPDAAAPRCAVEVWKDKVAAVDGGSAAQEWFGAYLGTPCRLVYQPEDGVRPVDPVYAVHGDHVSFADGFPVLLTNEASLSDLNARLEVPVPMNRFRPNIVVGACEAFAEDGWTRIRIGEVPFRVVKPCARCVVTTIDQGTAEPGVEPLRTLATYRRRGGKVLFGQNLIPAGPGIIRIGDPVVVDQGRAAKA